MVGMRNTLAALVLPLMLAACGGGQSNDKADPAPVETTTAPTTTTGQWASVVAGADLQATIDETLDACGPGLIHAGDALCDAMLLTVGLTSQTLVSKLDDLAATGEPPTEVAGLVDETREAAHALNGADTGDRASIARALMAFPGDEWQPYI